MACTLCVFSSSISTIYIKIPRKRKMNGLDSINSTAPFPTAPPLQKYTLRTVTCMQRAGRQVRYLGHEVGKRQRVGNAFSPLESRFARCLPAVISI